MNPQTLARSDPKSDHPIHVCEDRRDCSDGDRMMATRSDQTQVGDAELPRDEAMYPHASCRAPAERRGKG